MLFQLNDISKDDIAKQNQLKLSLIDEDNSNLFLPGKPLTDEQLNQVIDKSRNSGMISMENAHEMIRSAYNAG